MESVRVKRLDHLGLAAATVRKPTVALSIPFVSGTYSPEVLARGPTPQDEALRPHMMSVCYHVPETSVYRKGWYRWQAIENRSRLVNIFPGDSCARERWVLPVPSSRGTLTVGCHTVATANPCWRRSRCVGARSRARPCHAAPGRGPPSGQWWCAGWRR